MNLKYLIPLLGVYFVWQDIPQTPDEYRYKPLQGDSALFVIFASWIITALTVILIILYLLQIYDLK